MNLLQLFLNQNQLELPSHWYLHKQRLQKPYIICLLITSTKTDLKL